MKVNSLYCYECDSRYDEGCLDLANDNSNLVDCNDQKSSSIGYMCVKITKNTPVSLYCKIFLFLKIKVSLYILFKSSRMENSYKKMRKYQ